MARHHVRIRLGQRLDAELGDDALAAVHHPGRQRLECGRARRRRVERHAHHRLVIAHQPDRRIGADLRARRHRQLDRAQRIGPAVDEIAEEDEFAPLGAPGLMSGGVDQRLQKIGAAVDVADREDFDVGRRRSRQAQSFPVEDDGHKTLQGLDSEESRRPRLRRASQPR